MASDLQSARDDLAYMRGLVSGTGPMQATIGEAFFWAGALYGGQCILHWLQTLELVPSEGLVALAVVVRADFVFSSSSRSSSGRTARRTVRGVAARALGRGVSGRGPRQSGDGVRVRVRRPSGLRAYRLWLYHPIVVCMFQGVAWFVGVGILRRRWLGSSAVGWFVTTIALGVPIRQYRSVFC